MQVTRESSKRGSITTNTPVGPREGSSEDISPSPTNTIIGQLIAPDLKLTPLSDLDKTSHSLPIPSSTSVDAPPRLIQGDREPLHAQPKPVATPEFLEPSTTASTFTLHTNIEANATAPDAVLLKVIDVTPCDADTPPVAGYASRVSPASTPAIVETPVEQGLPQPRASRITASKKQPSIFMRLFGRLDCLYPKTGTKEIDEPVSPTVGNPKTNLLVTHSVHMSEARMNSRVKFWSKVFPKQHRVQLISPRVIRGCPEQPVGNERRIPSIDEKRETAAKVSAHTTPLEVKVIYANIIPFDQFQFRQAIGRKPIPDPREASSTTDQIMCIPGRSYTSSSPSNLDPEESHMPALEVITSQPSSGTRRDIRKRFLFKQCP